MENSISSATTKLWRDAPLPLAIESSRVGAGSLPQSASPTWSGSLLDERKLSGPRARSNQTFCVNLKIIPLVFLVSTSAGHFDASEEFLETTKGPGFFSTISRALKLMGHSRGPRTMAKGWTKQGRRRCSCGKRVGSFWTDTSPEEGMPDNENACARVERLACQRNPRRTRIHNRETASHSS